MWDGEGNEELELMCAFQPHGGFIILVIYPGSLCLQIQANMERLLSLQLNKVDIKGVIQSK